VPPTSPGHARADPILIHGSGRTRPSNLGLVLAYRISRSGEVQPRQCGSWTTRGLWRPATASWPLPGSASTPRPTATAHRRAADRLARSASCAVVLEVQCGSEKTADHGVYRPRAECGGLYAGQVHGRRRHRDRQRHPVITRSRHWGCRITMRGRPA